MHGLATPVVNLVRIEANRRVIVGATQPLCEVPTHATVDRAEADGTFGPIPPVVFGRRQQFEVLKPVVPLVAVPMVDVEALRDRPMRGDPDQPMLELLPTVAAEAARAVEATTQWPRGSTAAQRAEAAPPHRRRPFASTIFADLPVASPPTRSAHVPRSAPAALRAALLKWPEGRKRTMAYDAGPRDDGQAWTSSAFVTRLRTVATRRPMPEEDAVAVRATPTRPGTRDVFPDVPGSSPAGRRAILLEGSAGDEASRAGAASLAHREILPRRPISMQHA
jgi:hypothetical protein